MAIRNDWQPLVSIINKELRLLTAQEKDAIRSHYLTIQYDHGLQVSDMVLLGLALLLFFGLVLFFIVSTNRRLQREINQRKTLQQQLTDYVDMVDKYVITSSTDLNGTITQASQAFCDISQYTKAELIGKNHNIVHHPDTPKAQIQDLWETIGHHQVWEGELKNQAKDGSAYWVKSIIAPSFDENGRKTGYRSIRQNITNRKKIEALSITDPLTQCYNRKFYTQKLDELLSLYHRYDTPFSLLMFDIDDFKSINDLYGHKMGDRVLIGLSEKIGAQIRENDYLCRIGGEEFVILFSATTLKEARIVAEKIRHRVEDLITIQDRVVTISIGLTQVQEHDNADLMYQRTDKLLYYAKQNGKNQVATTVSGDVTYAYHIDEARQLIYERLSGTFLSLDVFEKTLMNAAFMKTYFGYQYIITDFRYCQMNFEHYESELLTIFHRYQQFYQNQTVQLKKAASLVRHFNHVKAIEPFRALQNQHGVITQDCHDIEPISDFLGFETRHYFELTEQQLTIIKPNSES